MSKKAKSKKSKKQTQQKDLGEATQEQILSLVSSLLSSHYDKIEDFRHASPVGKVGIALNVEIDYSKVEPGVKVKIGYCNRVNDVRSAVLTDPNQGTFTVIEEAAKKEMEKRTKRGSKKKPQPEPVETVAIDEPSEGKGDPEELF